MATIDINLVTLEYVCNNDDQHEGADDQVIEYQPLTDIVDSGTLTCPECGDDMELVGADLVGAPEPKTFDAAMKELHDAYSDLHSEQCPYPSQYDRVDAAREAVYKVAGLR